MYTLQFIVLAGLCLVQIHASVTSGLNSLFEYTTDQLLTENEGVVAAFGDFNADERCDIFVIADQSRSVDILFGKETKPFTRKNVLKLLDPDIVITSLVPADFDGDLQMDIMILTRGIVNKTGPYNALIYWGNHSNGSVGYPLEIPELMLDEPLVFDYNADMLPDLLAETMLGTRNVWLMQHNRTTRSKEFPESSLSDSASPFMHPQSHAFVDLNNDLAADVLLSTIDGFEVWLNLNGEFVHNSSYPYPEDLKHIGQSSFADIDQDKTQEHILPGCVDQDCTRSAIYVYGEDKWVERVSPSDFILSDVAWNFIPPDQDKYADQLNQTFLITLRIMDYNLDGYPDALAILRNSKTANPYQRVFLFENVLCSEDSCENFPRTFQLKNNEDSPLNTTNSQAVVGTFFDIYEDGMPDVVTTAMTKNANSDSMEPKIYFYKNDVAQDSCFVKVTVMSGLCYKDCPKENTAYSVNYPGPTVTYLTSNTDGKVQSSAGTQLSQTAHFALQTPYQSFGLGSTPNFLDSFQVGIPWAKGKPLSNKTWHFIIPNSQLIVIPHPLHDTSSWKLKLYVTPSQLVYLTGAALLGTCGFVAVIVGVLQFRENREDKLEKKQEAQKFHFDAM